MSRKMFMAAVTLALSLAFVGTLGSGVAAAHGGKNPGGGVFGHGGHSVSGGPAHGGKNVGADGGIGVGAGATSKNTDVGTGATSQGTDVGGGAGSHGKKDGKKGGPVVLTGSTTCSIHGKVTFNPPLTIGGTTSTTVTVTGLLNRCSNARQGKVKFNNGHLSSLLGTLSADDCAALTSVAPALSGGSIMWTSPSKVAGSSGVSMPVGAGSMVTHDGKSVIQISYSGGSVSSGSFTNTGGSSLQVTSTQDATQLSDRCTTGLTNVAFSGTATL